MGQPPKHTANPTQLTDTAQRLVVLPRGDHRHDLVAEQQRAALRALVGQAATPADGVRASKSDRRRAA